MLFQLIVTFSNGTYIVFFIFRTTKIELKTKLGIEDLLKVTTWKHSFVRPECSYSYKQMHYGQVIPKKKNITHFIILHKQHATRKERGIEKGKKILEDYWKLFFPSWLVNVMER